MSPISVTIADAFGARGRQMQIENEVPVEEVVLSLCDHLGWPELKQLDLAGGLFTRSAARVWLYLPRWGVLDPEKPIAGQPVRTGDTLRLYASLPKSAELSLAAIRLAHGEPLTAAARCVALECAGHFYPVLLPASPSPEGQDGMLWLVNVVARQIRDINPQATLPVPWQAYRCYNTRTRAWLEPDAQSQPLGEQVAHGDCLRLLPQSDDAIVILEEVREAEGPPQGAVDTAVGDDILAQIQIEAGEDETEITFQEEGLLVGGDASTSVRVGHSIVELVRGDITQQPLDAIVNAARSDLSGGGGVDGAIHQTAGPALARSSRSLAPCPAGEAVLTPGFGLPARWVIHTVGPVYTDGTHGEAETLASAYRSILAMTINSGFTSLALPSISTGAYRYPIVQAARIALETVMEVLATQDWPGIARFVLFSTEDFAAYRAEALRRTGTPATPPE